MPGVPLPLSPADRARWRAAVVTLLGTERGRGFPHRLHLGRPDGGHVTFTPPAGPLDAADRRHVIDMLLAQVPLDPGPTLWLTRPGEPGAHDEDMAWRSATVDSCAADGRPCTMVVVTPHGWYDPDTGAGQRWVRLRARRSGPGATEA